MSGYKRAQRVSIEVHRALAEVLLRGLKDPRVGSISITSVTVTDDLRLARVRFLPLGGRGKEEEIVAGLRSASGYLSREVSKIVRSKYTPRLEFFIDESPPQAIAIVDALDELSPDEEEDSEG